MLFHLAGRLDVRVFLWRVQCTGHQLSFPPSSNIAERVVLQFQSQAEGWAGL